MTEERSLAGQVAWITGSSRGLGRVMATRLCRMGALVAVHGTRFDSPKSFSEGDSMEQVARDIASEAAGRTMPIWGDVTDEAEVKRMAQAIRANLGRIDILVTNAGGDIGAGGTDVGRGGRPSPDECIGIPLADIRAVLDRNLLSCILCCREVAPEMMARKHGRIITIGSIAGTFGRDDGAVYSVAKAAVHEYTRCLAVQLRPFNVPVNCIAPGGTVTNRFLVIHDIEQEKLIEEGTLVRYGRAHEVAAAVAFLASEDGRFISGQVIRVDGGSQCWPA
ncbi:MAG TPA: SDR family oxidoreductase [Gemmataceae bacterium]|jgi:3-oxoacyl-[acyl-carrier protein] reductase|nr:SDR family oxidoreductase [Gemmataceae bacterium]